MIAGIYGATPRKPLVCNQLPIRGFGKVWADHIDIQHKLGCLLLNERGIEAAVQQFQHGFMLWVEQDSVGDSASVYVFINNNTYHSFGTTRSADPPVVGRTPSGFYPIGDRFSAVYWEGTGARIKEQLGYATTPPMDSATAFQQFTKGQMFWPGTIDRIFVVYNYPSSWASFEDTFN